MQSVLILSPSSSPARAATGPAADAPVAPCGGFSLALGGDYEGADEDLTVDPAGAEGLASALVPLWAGTAMDGGRDEPAPLRAALPVAATGLPGTGAVETFPGAAVEAGRAGDGGLPVGAAAGAAGEGDADGEAEIFPGSEEGLPVGIQIVATLFGGPLPVAGAGEAADMGDGYRGSPDRPGRPHGAAVWQAETSSVIAPFSGPDLRQRAAVEQAVGQMAGDGGGFGERLIPAATGGDPGLAPSNPQAAVELPLRAPVPVRLPESGLAGEGKDSGSGPRAVEPGSPASAPGGVAGGLAEGGAEGDPQASFWERLLSGVAASNASAEAGPMDGDAVHTKKARAGEWQVGGVAISVAARSAGVALARPDSGRPGGPVEPVGAGAVSLETAETPQPEAVRSDYTGRPPEASQSGPRTAGEHAPLPALSAAEAAPEPDPGREASDDSALFALGTGPLPSSAMSAGSPSGALAVPIPQLAARLTAALTPGAEGETELALSPEELGQVRVKLKPDAAHPDRLVVMITFERPETLDLFRRHAGELADAFRAAGYSGADIGFGQQDSGQADPDRREGTAGRSLDGPSRPDPSPPAPLRPLGAASLDLRL